jgi:hypothetical protein
MAGCVAVVAAILPGCENPSAGPKSKMEFEFPTDVCSSDELSQGKPFRECGATEVDG